MKDTPLDIHECIEFLLENKGMTVYGLSKELGFDKPAKLYTILNRRTKPSYDTLVSITNRFDDINGDWLLRGTGEPYMNPSGSTPQIQSDRLNERNQNLEKQIADRNETIELLKQQIIILREVINHSHRNGTVQGKEVFS
ncbi:helix-turn-helix transcriptional regulator [Persicitalea sp.]|uniref:helix-turn-helix domain-containing protein n=1 Tax=Persicitalea sp. TaxID=3100273 RepID=UPI0035948A15